MNTRKIYDEDGKGFTRIFSHDKVEKVNPVEFYQNYQLQKTAIGIRDMLSAKNPFLTSRLPEAFFLKKASELLQGFFDEFRATKVPEIFIKLLNTEKKKDQIKLLKGQTITTDILMSLIFISYEDFGYLYSKYTFENLAKGTDEDKLPKLIKVNDDDSVHKVGQTELTDGDLRNVINSRKVIVSHFFEKEKLWHCLFLTYNSIAGKENWKNGQPHFHYISSSFGISKEAFIESMESGNYKSTSIHIDLLDYGTQPSKNTANKT